MQPGSFWWGLRSCFYLLYVAGILVFVSAPAGATWQSTLLYGALFGVFCYATFELTSLSLLKHWTWPVAIVDVSWGAFCDRAVLNGGAFDRQPDHIQGVIFEKKNAR